MALLFNRPTPTMPLSPRACELLELAASEGFDLPLSVELILWLEDRGHVVDLHTGEASLPVVGAPTPNGRAVAHLLSAVVWHE